MKKGKKIALGCIVAAGILVACVCGLMNRNVKGQKEANHPLIGIDGVPGNQRELQQADGNKAAENADSGAEDPGTFSEEIPSANAETGGADPEEQHNTEQKTEESTGIAMGDDRIEAAVSEDGQKPVETVLSPQNSGKADAPPQTEENGAGHASSVLGGEQPTEQQPTEQSTPEQPSSEHSEEIGGDSAPALPTGAEAGQQVHEHSFEKVYWYGEPTCATVNNYYNLICTTCGENGGTGCDEIPHTPEITETESMEGCTRYRILEGSCRVCGYTLDRQVIPIGVEHQMVTMETGPVWDEVLQDFVTGTVTCCSNCGLIQN